MPGLSIHVVDVSRGVVGTGMQVALHRCGDGGKLDQIMEGAIGAAGLLEAPELATIFPAGRYLVLFHVGDFYRRAGIKLPAVPFLDVVQFAFGISDPGQHYHLPFKCTPWGFSCFRGGA
ncbi:MAG: hydroxyisourate hydrolase [Xanthobacteraceae bacterium]